MNKNSGAVAPTQQELQLQQNVIAQFQDYQKRWLPVQDHLGDVVSSMGKSDSWQRKEAEGKANVDTSTQFDQALHQKESQAMSHGINVGSANFKLGVTGAATAEAHAKGAAIEQGNEQITRAYLGGLNSIAQAGNKIAGTATQGLGMSAEIASREAITQSQEDNATRYANMKAAGMGIGLAGGLYANSIGNEADLTVMQN
jgi:hypothetical protein